MRTLDQFKKEFYTKYPNSDIKILNFSKKINKQRCKNYIYIKNKYGVCEMSKINVLKGSKSSIRSAINKTKYFINQAREIHDNKYDYSKTIYVNDSKKIIIVCKQHGEFKQSPNQHLYHDNCPKCGFYQISLKNVSNTYDFINKANIIHNNKYDYSESVYIGYKQKIKIICREHGSFEQKPNSHLNGHGCFKCGRLLINSNAKQNPSGWNKTNWFDSAKNSKRFDSFKVYIIKCWDNEEEFYKIGRTFLNVQKRFHAKTRFPYNYKIIKVHEFKDLSQENAIKAFDLENQLKRENKQHKYIPQIKFSGSSECFNQIIKY